MQVLDLIQACMRLAHLLLHPHYAHQEGAYDPDDVLARNTQNLMHAVSSLPELQEQKKVGHLCCVDPRMYPCSLL